MKKFSKKYWMIIGWVLVVLTVYSVIAGHNTLLASTSQVAECDTHTVTSLPFAKCRLDADTTISFKLTDSPWKARVKNVAGSPSYLLPLNSPAEWTAFSTNPPPGVTVEDLCLNGLISGATTGTPADCTDPPDGVNDCCRFAVGCPAGWSWNGWASTTGGGTWMGTHHSRRGTDPCLLPTDLVWGVYNVWVPGGGVSSSGVLACNQCHKDTTASSCHDHAFFNAITSQGCVPAFICYDTESATSSTPDSGCSTTNKHCINEVCVKCTDNTHCSGSVCSGGTCVECVGSGDCSGTDVCDGNTCVGCVGSGDCSGGDSCISGECCEPDPYDSTVCG